METQWTTPTSRVIKLQNNAFVVNTKAGSVLVNSPPETLKILLARDLPIPKVILLPPDIPVGTKVGSSGFVRFGINYASVEFLLYANYFLDGKQKTRLITATLEQAQRLNRILQETIIGPPSVEDYYPRPWIRRECRALSYLPILGHALELDDIVEINSLEFGGGVLGDEVEVNLENDAYVFFEDGIPIATIPTIIESEPLPLTLAPPQPVPKQEITLQFIGGSDGFDPQGITTCFLAYFGTTGRDTATLFDVAAYLRVRLGHLGIALGQISDVFISHLHEDHIAGLPELLLRGHRIRLITSRIIYSSLLRVLSAMLAISEPEAAGLFDFCPLDPDHPITIEGKHFEAIYGIHTIPTLAVRVNGLCYSGDMRYDEKWFAKLVEDGVLSESRMIELMLFPEGSRILVQDAGGGDVHTTPTSENLITLAAKSKHIILTHTRKEKHRLPKALTDWKNVDFAEDGHVAAIGPTITSHPNAEMLETISTCPLYARLSVAEQLHLAENVMIQSWDAGETIIQQGDPSGDTAYIVHRGLVKVSINYRTIQILGRGTSVGERGVLTFKPRSATIEAFSDVQLLVLDHPLFHSIADKLGLSEVVERAEWLSKHLIFKHLPWATLLDLALDFQPIHLPTGRLLYEYGKPANECYLLISGEVVLFNENLEPLGSFDTSGEFFGGRAVLSGATYKTYAGVSKESVLWSLSSAALQRFQLLYPSIILHLRTVESKRLGEERVISLLEFNSGIQSNLP